MNEIDSDIDAVVHLAGLYDFRSGLTSNYQQNVLPTVNLLDKVKELNAERKAPIRFFYASSYSVGFGVNDDIAEEPLKQLPSKRMPYAYTKAVAERAVTDSGVPGAVFRLGVLVGDSRSGNIEKLDGPYHFIELLHKVSAFRGARLIPAIPIPAKASGVLPLVPVDIAAAVIHEAIFADNADGVSKIYGVYDAENVRIGEFCEDMVAEFMPSSRALLLDSVPIAVLRYQEKVTGIPEEVFRFSTEPVRLENRRFRKDFARLAIPAFRSYRKAFLEGFFNYVGGRFE